MMDYYNEPPIIIRTIDTPIIDSYSFSDTDNHFVAFKSIDNILCVIYTNKRRSIILYNLIDKKKISEIKNAHDEKIDYIKYYFDSINKRDLFISGAKLVKLWNANKLECLFVFGDMNSACFLREKNDIFIVGCKENIIVFDLDGNTEKIINSIKYTQFEVDSYYDNKLLQNYIITSNKNSIISYDYEKNKELWEYRDEGFNIYSRSIAITDDNEMLKLISASWIGIIRIWNFRSGELISKIKVSNDHTCGICLWDSRYLFLGNGDKKLKLIDLKSYKIINEFEDHEDYVITIKKIIHPQFGECLLTQGYFAGKIKLWISK